MRGRQLLADFYLSRRAEVDPKQPVAIGSNTSVPCGCHWAALTDALDIYSPTVYILVSRHSGTRGSYVSSEQSYRPSFQSKGY